MSAAGPNQVPSITSPTWPGSAACQCRRGVSAWKSTGSVSSAHSAARSLLASARANRSPTGAVTPGSVAERGGWLIAYPFPQRHRAAQRGVGHQGTVLQLLGGEADRADQVPAARRLVAFGQLGQGRAAHTGGALRDTVQRQPDRLLGAE